MRRLATALVLLVIALSAGAAMAGCGGGDDQGGRDGNGASGGGGEGSGDAGDGDGENGGDQNGNGESGGSGDGGDDGDGGDGGNGGDGGDGDGDGDGGDAPTASTTILFGPTFSASVPFDVGSARVGGSTAFTVALDNRTGRSLVLISVRLSGDHAGDYAIRDGSCTIGLELAAGSSCDVEIAFTPRAAGARQAVFSATADGQTRQRPLVGTGQAEPGVDPTPSAPSGGSGDPAPDPTPSSSPTPPAGAGEEQDAPAPSL